MLTHVCTVHTVCKTDGLIYNVSSHSPPYNQYYNCYQQQKCSNATTNIDCKVQILLTCSWSL